MKKFSILTLATCFIVALFAIAFTACDSGSSSSGTGENEITAATFDDLEACTESLEGESAYVKDEKAMYTCEGGKWTVCTDCDSSDTPSDAKKSSASKAKSSASKGKAETSSSAKSESTEPGKSSAKETSSSSKANASDDDDNSEIVLGGKCVEGKYEVVEINGEKKIFFCDNEEKGWEIYVSKTKSSSSSVVRSSSSAHYAALVDDPLSIKNHGEFEDPRDHEKYATIEISNTCGDDSLHITYTVMAQNLKYYEKMTPGAEEQDDDEHVERYCYNDSVEYCNDWWGALYQWAEAMALPYKCNHEPCDNLIDPDGDGFHQGICPDGWHILNWREAKAAEFNEKCRTNGYTMMSARTFLVGKGTNYSGFSAIAAGRRVSPEDYVYEGKWFDQLRRESTVWFSLEEKDEKYINDAIGYHFGEYAVYWHTEKTEGNMVRCVKDY